jgi:lysophospholipase L1-like esterase
MKRLTAVIVLLAASCGRPSSITPHARPLRLVVVGDSVAHGAGDEHGLGISGSLDHELRLRGIAAEPVLNLGINGARTFNVHALLARKRAALLHADIAIVSIGGNDLYGDTRARLLSTLFPAVHQILTAHNVRRIVAELHALNPAMRIYVLGLYNPYRGGAQSTWLDRQVNLWDARLIAQFAALQHVTVIRICDLLDRPDRISSVDHFHPGAMGYEEIARRIVSGL